MPTLSHCPEHLEPSELGTKQYWDDYYKEDLAIVSQDESGRGDLGRLSTWFDDVNAPQKILKFLVDEEFPLAPCRYRNILPEGCPSILDLGTGNGQTLLQLRVQGGFRGRMVGVDYSEASIRLAQELGNARDDCKDIIFEVMDIMRDEHRKQAWWLGDGFDLVLDKGTFDAISLYEEVVEPSTSHHLPTGQAAGRVHTLYPSRVLSMVKPGGFLLVTSCNWTQEELIHWFTTTETRSSHEISVWKVIDYPKFRFGGNEGQGICTVCFQRVRTREEHEERKA